ncbi:hypothetical protein CCP3SC1AL1_520002 [Gammaproteobacteria bacterium]
METEQEEFLTDDYVEMPTNPRAEVQFRTLKVGYHNESFVYAGIYRKKIANNNVQYLTDKITRHFKIASIRVVFHTRMTRGSASYYSRRITLPYNTNFGTLCHEINHFLCWKKFGIGDNKARHGTKRWNRALQRIMKYCVGKNFWEQDLKDREKARQQRQLKEIELNKKQREEAIIRDALKGMEKLKPTKEEKQKQKRVEIEQKIKGFQRRTKLYQTKIKKLQKKLKRLL